MPDRWMGLIELVLVFGIVIGWAVWELVKLRRDKRRGDGADQR